MTARVIAIVGAESTGKTTLAQALAQRLAAGGAARTAWVPEALRDWCAREGRTPRADEQRAIAQAQHARIAAAAAAHEIVVADTTALMTAVYSRLVFDDDTLDAEAVALHRRDVAVTLLTAVDLPWVPDGHQRDGEHVREPVDATLRALLAANGIEHAVVGGRGPRRVERAWAALQRPAGDDPAAPRTGAGPFTRLLAGDDAAAWWCECCVPEHEQALLRAAAR